MRAYDIHEIVLFNWELTNYGGFYSSQTSSFICPVDGVYVFSLTINAHDANVHVKIMRNDIDLSDAWAYALTVPYTHGTNMVVTECLVGDVVWPRVASISGTGEIYAQSNYCYTTFSGVLIKTI